MPADDRPPVGCAASPHEERPLNIPYDKLFAPVIASKKGSENLVADPRCREIFRIAKGPTLPPLPPGEPPPPVQEPDWAVIRDGCIELLSRSADLTVALWYTVALIKLDGWAGLAEGLGAVRYMVENLYDKLYPGLDPDEPDNPAWRRINVIRNLAVPIARRDEFGVLRRVRETPIVVSRNLGSFSLWSMLVAGGVLPPREGGEAKPEMGLIDRAFADGDLQELETTLKLIRESREHAREIVGVFKGDAAAGRKGRAPAGAEPDLGPLIKMLEDCARQLEKTVSERGRTGPVDQTSPGGGGSSGGGGRGAPVRSGVATKKDVQAALDKIVEWYMQDEERQASPTLLLVQAARQMMGKTFVEAFKVADDAFVKKLEEIIAPKPPEAKE